MEINVKFRFINYETGKAWCPMCAIPEILKGTVFKTECEEYEPEYEFDRCEKCNVEIQSMYQGKF